MSIAKNFIGKKVIVRGDRSGVFFGTVLDHDKQQVVLKDCRRIYSWQGALETNEIAVVGVLDNENTKITRTVDEILINDCIQMQICTNKAIEILESVKVWNE